MLNSKTIPTEGLMDFQCHLDLYPDHQAAFQETEEAGTTTQRGWAHNHELAQKMRHIRAEINCSMNDQMNSICGDNAYLRYDTLGKWGSTPGHVSTNRLICRSVSFSTFCSVARKPEVKSLAFTVFG